MYEIILKAESEKREGIVKVLREIAITIELTSEDNGLGDTYATDGTLATFDWDLTLMGEEEEILRKMSRKDIEGDID